MVILFLQSVATVVSVCKHLLLVLRKEGEEINSNMYTLF